MRIFPETATADAHRLLWARGARALADGFVSILLPAYLVTLGYDAFDVGVITTATLLGSAALTLFAGRITARFGHRGPLLAATVLMVCTGLAFATVQAFWPLLVIAFVGTLNPASGDVSIFLPIEQSLLARSVDKKDRTELFAHYSLAGSLMGAVGTLLAAAPDFASRIVPGLTEVGAMQAMFAAYGALGLAAALCYRGLTREDVHAEAQKSQPLGPSRHTVYRLVALFSIDSFGGGFMVQTILALWLLQVFDLPVAATASILFWSNLLTAASFLVSVRIARRIGLINTMVFTHLPANLCMMAIPFTSDLHVVIGLLMVRSFLSQMDVPTRTSYVMAVVTPPERPAAASLTNVPRSLAAAISPTIAGYLLLMSSFGWPLLIGGALKVAYDVALLAMFRRVRPPEEEGAETKAA
ncbi:MAG TPA: MFS transporter [Alphaproteobacteria bacterium]